MIGGGFVSLDSEGKPLPGARAAFVAVVLVILGGLALVFVPGNEVDDRDEVVPASGQFRGLYIEARELLNPDAAPLETENVTLLELVGPAALLYALLPLLIVLGAYWMHRRMGRSLPLTVGMLVLAVLFMLLGGAGMFFIPALIALAVGSFQARRVELPARMAERAARRGEAPAADASDDDDEDIEDDLDDEDYEEEDYDDEDEEDFIDDEDFSTEDEDEDEAEEEGYGFASDKRK